jgi:hypothetical protein
MGTPQVKTSLREAASKMAWMEMKPDLKRRALRARAKKASKLEAKRAMVPVLMDNMRKVKKPKQVKHPQLARKPREAEALRNVRLSKKNLRICPKSPVSICFFLRYMKRFQIYIYSNGILI